MYDVGAGTGIVAQKLRTRGFCQLEGGDSSEQFVKAAQQKGLYQDIEVRWFGMGVHRLPANKLKQFDCVVASGVWLDGHIPAVGMEDCHALLRKGGLFITAMRSQYWVKGQREGYKDKMNELVKEGKLERVEVKKFFRGIENAEAKMFEQMESTLIVYRRIN